MCIIIAKDKGIPAPTVDVFKQCYKSNPHGMGFMFAMDNVVCIEKGFMNFEQFMDAIHQLGDVTDFSVVYHFRIATEGAITGGNCHPFPISDDVAELNKFSTVDSIGIAHNGIIDIPAEQEMSDTMTFIKQVLFPIKESILSYNKGVLSLIKHAVRGSRLAIMYGTGEIMTMGNGWVVDKETRLLFSNSSYKTYIWQQQWLSWKDRCETIDTQPLDLGYKGLYDRVTLRERADEIFYCNNCGGPLLRWGDDYYCEECDDFAGVDLCIYDHKNSLFQ